MRKIVVAAFVSLDGVMQAPGGPKEDPSGGFELGGWVAGYFDEVVGSAMGEIFATPYELLLGRKTYDIFAAHWPRITDPKQPDYPIAEQFNRIAKHVATHRPESLTWKNSHPLGIDVASALRALKKTDGPSLLTQGSSDLVQTLFANDLVDELRVLTFPIVLGKGKRLFGGGAMPAGYRLASTKVSPSGVVIASYARAGEVKRGSFELAS
ncbi:MAG TPA: dihydrofolate reductase family protein [Labilithrix sp.]